MEQNNVQNNDEVEIDLLEVFYVLLDKIWAIILSGVLAALVVVAATLLFVTPQYESTTKMYVLSKQDSNTLTSQDMQTSLSLTKDYAELIDQGLCRADQEPYSYRGSYYPAESGYDS